MAKKIVGQERFFVGQEDISPFQYEGMLEMTQDVVDVTTFANVNTGGVASYRDFICGNKSGNFSFSCYRDRNDNFEQNKETWAGGGVPLTVALAGATNGADAILAEITQAKFTHAFQVGEAEKVMISGVCDEVTGPGKIIRDNVTNVTATGTSTAIQLGAVPAGKTAAFNLHVLDVSGTAPQLTVTLHNAAASNMTGQVLAATSAIYTGRGFECLKSKVVTANTWWRATFTVSGTTPSFKLLLSGGIL